MTKGGQFKTVTVAALAALVWMASKADAAQCGSTAAGRDVALLFDCNYRG
jgi:hypothetical protein